MAPRPFDPAFTYQPGRENARLREQRARRIAAGQCFICRKPPRPNRQLCESCAEQQRVSKQRGRQKPENKAHNNETRRAYQQKHKAKGLCVFCLKPRVPDSRRYCQVHFEYMREWAYRASKRKSEQQGRSHNIRWFMTREEYVWLKKAKSSLRQLKTLLTSPPTASQLVSAESARRKTSRS